MVENIVISIEELSPLNVGGDISLLIISYKAEVIRITNVGFSTIASRTNTCSLV